MAGSLPLGLAQCGDVCYNIEIRRKGGRIMAQAEQSVSILNGIGAKKAEALARLGLTTLGDLAQW